jgi:putative restriction endonuclease
MNVFMPLIGIRFSIRMRIFSENESVDQLAKRLVADPASSGEIFARVKVRGVRQRIFRSALLMAYLQRCAFCGLSVSFALEAAHIVRYCEADEVRLFDPRNGILLCSTHHRLFDAGLVKIDDSFKLVGTREMVGEDSNVHSTALQTVALNGRLIGLPTHRHLWPDVKALSLHRDATG